MTMGLPAYRQTNLYYRVLTIASAEVEQPNLFTYLLP